MIGLRGDGVRRGVGVVPVSMSVFGVFGVGVVAIARCFPRLILVLRIG
jgi:hypothetical protein